MGKDAPRFAVQECDATMFDQRTNVWPQKIKSYMEENTEVFLKSCLPIFIILSCRASSQACAKREGRGSQFFAAFVH